MFSNGPIIWLRSVTSAACATGLQPAGGAPGAAGGQGHTGGAVFFFISLLWQDVQCQTDTDSASPPPPSLPPLPPPLINDPPFLFCVRTLICKRAISVDWFAAAAAGWENSLALSDSFVTAVFCCCCWFFLLMYHQRP